MSIEMAANSSEKTWSYGTQYDVVDRAKIIANEGEHGPRVVDMDNYIHYINHEMPEGYMASTQMDIDPYYGVLEPVDGDEEYEREVVIVFQPNEEGTFVPVGRTDTYGEFLGDKVVVEGDTMLLVNTAESIAVIAHRHIKLVNVSPSSPDDPYPHRATRVSFFKSRLGRVLYDLEHDNPYF